jgi:hypothetical protein
MGSADENKYIKKKYHCSNFFLCQKLKSWLSFIQLKTILDIFLSGFGLSNCPQHCLKVLLLIKYVFNCEENILFFIFQSGLTVAGLAMVYFTFKYCIQDGPKVT